MEEGRIHVFLTVCTPGWSRSRTACTRQPNPAHSAAAAQRPSSGGCGVTGALVKLSYIRFMRMQTLHSLQQARGRRPPLSKTTSGIPTHIAHSHCCCRPMRLEPAHTSC